VALGYLGVHNGALYIFKIRRKKFTPAGPFPKESFGKLEFWLFLQRKLWKSRRLQFKSRTLTILPRRDVSHLSGETTEKNLGLKQRSRHVVDDAIGLEPDSS
jgi:hypothetical protein